MKRISTLLTGIFLGAALVLAGLYLFYPPSKRPAVMPSKSKAEDTRVGEVLDTIVNTGSAVAKGDFQTLHEVKKGDSLYSIAKHYSVTVEAIKQANREKSDTLVVGETLVIPRRDGRGD